MLQSGKTQIAPPRYRPSPKNVAQPKIGSTSRKIPASSPAYRPQPTPRVVQLAGGGGGVLNAGAAIFVPAGGGGGAAAPPGGGGAVGARPALNAAAAPFVPAGGAVVPPPARVGAGARVDFTLAFSADHTVAVMAPGVAKHVGERRGVDLSTVLLGTYITAQILADAQGKLAGNGYIFSERASNAGNANIQLAERKPNGTYSTVALGMYNYSVSYDIFPGANRIQAFHLACV